MKQHLVIASIIFTFTLRGFLSGVGAGAVIAAAKALDL
jgi:hypothetical protein